MRPQGRQLRPQAQRLLLQQLLSLQPVGRQLQVSARRPLPEVGQIDGGGLERDPRADAGGGHQRPLARRDRRPPNSMIT
jgi:hypothetical protein